MIKRGLLILIAILFIIDISKCSEQQEQVNLEDCLKRCENKAEEECENPEKQDICTETVQLINECIEAKCQKNFDSQEQTYCADNCVQEKGHKGIINYNKCIDKCIDIADPEELQQFQLEALKDDDEYQQLLKQWESILEDGEIDSKSLKNFLEQFEEGALIDLLPTEKKMEKQQKNDL